MTIPEEKPGGHLCEGSTKSGAYGNATYKCFEDPEGFFWVDNEEYGNQVNFCPYCGTKAPRAAEMEESRA